MKWRIEYSKDAIKFVNKQNIHNEVREEIKKFFKRIEGENINIDLKKLEGVWARYYRLKKGKVRIIFEINKLEKALFVEKVDFRGDVYK